MATARLLAPWVGTEQRSAIYHVVSRVIHQRFLLRDQEKEQFVKFMRTYEAFCGVRVLSYCIMSNHFHILVEVPPNMQHTLTDEALLTRLSLLYSNDYIKNVSQHLHELAKNTHTEQGRQAHAAYRDTFTRRMWDLGHFMKTLKQRFTRWYNHLHASKGTLWEARYKSSLVQDGEAARTITAYIDLNPVRAGITNDPKNYRWCTYAQAVVGGKNAQLARRGIARIFQERENQQDSDTAHDGWQNQPEPAPEQYAWRSIAGRYRLILFEDGQEIIDADGKTTRKGLTRTQLEKETKTQGKLSTPSLLHTKTRHFIDGGIIGSKTFLKTTINALKGNHLKADRKSQGTQIHPQKSKDKNTPHLYTLRQLRNP